MSGKCIAAVVTTVAVIALIGIVAAVVYFVVVKKDNGIYNIHITVKYFANLRFSRIFPLVLDTSLQRGGPELLVAFKILKIGP